MLEHLKRYLSSGSDRDASHLVITLLLARFAVDFLLLVCIAGSSRSRRHGTRAQFSSCSFWCGRAREHKSGVWNVLLGDCCDPRTIMGLASRGRHTECAGAPLIGRQPRSVLRRVKEKAKVRLISSKAFIFIIAGAVICVSCGRCEGYQVERRCGEKKDQ